MEKISIFNYEAYYLDFLEGNLSDEDAVLLQAFLNEHPECKLEEDELMSYTSNDVYEFVGKNELKMVDNSDVITHLNYKDFMIQSTEGIIEDKKQIELNAFVAINNLENEFKQFKAVYFQPDYAAVYSEKAELKKPVVFVLWPYLAAASVAACLILLVTIWNRTKEGNVIETNTQASLIENPTTIQKDKTQPTNINRTGFSVIDKNTNRKETNAEKQSRIVDYGVSDMNVKPTRQILSNLGERKIEPITERTFKETSPEVVVNATEDYASVNFGDMDNPIEPITKLISSKTNTEVDFRREKPSKRKSGGFFVKVGKFELSHKKY